MGASECPPGVPQTSDLPDLIGPGLAGILIASVLLGVLVNQVVNYARDHAHDYSLNRAAIALVSSLSLLSWANNWDLLWRTIVQGTSHPCFPLAPPANYVIATLSAVFSNSLSESFFAFRAYRLSGSKHWMGAVLVALVLAPFSVGLTCIILEGNPKYGIETNGEASQEFLRLMVAGLCLNAFADLVITGILFGVLAHKRATLAPNSRLRFTCILRGCVVTGCVTAMLSIVSAILKLATIHTEKTRNAQQAIGLLVPQVVGLVIVGTLNMRPTSKEDKERAGKVDLTASYYLYDEDSCGLWSSAVPASRRVDLNGPPPQMPRRGDDWSTRSLSMDPIEEERWQQSASEKPEHLLTSSGSEVMVIDRMAFQRRDRQLLAEPNAPSLPNPLPWAMVDPGRPAYHSSLSWESTRV